MQRVRAAESLLRRARRHRNWTLRRVVEEIDRRAAVPTGVTESQVSTWELGKAKTSMRYRELLCQAYGLPPEALFADQDGAAPVLALAAGQRHEARLVTSFVELQAELVAVVDGAREWLVAVGSRSRDRAYLGMIERVLRERPRLVHYRVLFGPPRRPLLADHVLRLLELRDPQDRSEGIKTLHVGMIDDLAGEPERNFCASERRAVIALPSVRTAGGFDSGVVLLDAADALGLVQHATQLYAAARRVETREEIERLAAAR